MSTSNPYIEPSSGKIYKWPDTHAWLYEAWMEEGRIGDSEIWQLILKLDGDTIASLLSPALDTDGYYDPGILCPECGGWMEPTEECNTCGYEADDEEDEDETT